MAFVGDLAVYRLIFKGHFYTTDCNECVGAINNQWRYEGTQCHISSSAAVGLVPFYRFLINGMHFYTASENEKDVLIQNGAALEGIIGYVSARATGGTVPLYRGLNRDSGDHFYTTDLTEFNLAIQAGWVDEGIAAYVSPNNRRDCAAILSTLLARNQTAAPPNPLHIPPDEVKFSGAWFTIGPGTPWQTLIVSTLPCAGWKWDTGGRSCGAAGNGTYRGSATLPDAPQGALIWRRSHSNATGVQITDELGPWTQDIETISFTKDGNYSFGMNDDNFGDNSGNLAAQWTLNTY